jgi:hypothetical protein
MWRGRLLGVLICLGFVFAIGLILGHLFQEIDRWTAF